MTTDNIRAALDAHDAEDAHRDLQLEATAAGLKEAKQRADAADAALAQAQTDLEAARKQYADHMATHVVVTEPKYPIPAEALRVHPDGDDSNPGTEARPRRTPLWGRVNELLGGQHNGVTWRPPKGAPTRLIVRPGSTVVFDGSGTVKDAIYASGRCDLLGSIVVQNYGGTSKENGTSTPVYFGGTSDGSTVDGLIMRHLAMAGLGFMRPVNLLDLTIEDTGYCGLMGTAGKGTKIGILRTSRVNRKGFQQDGQLAAVKITKTPDLSVDTFIGRDIPIGNAFWLDEGCQNHDLGYMDIDGAGADGKSTMAHGVHIEVSQGGRLRKGGKVRGSTTAGMMILDAGSLDIWEWDLRGNFTGFWAQQDRRQNATGRYPGAGTPAENPMLTRDLSLRNLTLDGPQQLWAYAENAQTPAAGEDFFREIRGTWFAPKQVKGQAIRMGDKGANTSRSLTLEQLQQNLGARASSNYQGSDAVAAAQVRVPA